MGHRKQTIKDMKRLFDLVYEDFGVNTNQIMDHFKWSRSKALRLCKILESMDLFCGEETFMDGVFYGRNNARTGGGVGRVVMWQCCNTVNSYEQSEHEAEFWEAFEGV